MVRATFTYAIAAALALCAPLASLRGADPKPKPAASKDIDALRQAVEEQSKQIESLTQQVAHLTELIEEHSGSVAAATPAPSPSPSPTPASPTAEGSPVVVTPGGPQPAVENSGTHTVSKGETLTSIAKHYKISVTELQKVNKIENDRTLQIGQVLIIPASTTSPTPEDKKENQ